MSALSRKIDFAVILRVKNANPNGDPLNGNRPRTDYEGHGEMSDVCIKRKIRDRLMNNGQKIFVQSDDYKIDEFPNLRQRAESVLGKLTEPVTVRKKACEEWFDVRAFGQLFPFKGKNKKAKANVSEQMGEEDANGVSIAIRGPVTVQSALSIEPIQNKIANQQIVKSTSLEGDGINRQPDQMGMKYKIEGEAIYRFFGTMNPQLAEGTGFSDSDAEIIKTILPRLFENDASAARPEGSMEVLKVIWWQHNCKPGQYSSAKVHRSLVVNADGTYTLENLEGLKPEEMDGF